MALAGSVFAVNSNPLILIIAAVLGTISPFGKEVGPFLSIEQAILPQTTQDLYRTRVFSAYNLVGSIFGALGALIVGLPLLLPLPPLSGYRFLLWSYVFCALLMMGLFALLSPSIEVITGIETQSGRFDVQQSRGIVMKLSGLFSLDAFAGGLIVQSIIAYWFYLRYQTDLTVLGASSSEPICWPRSRSQGRGNCAPFRTPEDDGFYPFGFQSTASACAVDAHSGIRRGDAVGA